MSSWKAQIWLTWWRQTGSLKWNEKSFNLISSYCLQICQPCDISNQLSAKVRRNGTAMKIITKLWALFKFEWGTLKKQTARCWSCTLGSKIYCPKPSFLQCRPLQLFLGTPNHRKERIKGKVSFYYLKFARAQKARWERLARWLETFRKTIVIKRVIIWI